MRRDNIILLAQIWLRLTDIAAHLVGIVTLIALSWHLISPAFTWGLWLSWSAAIFVQWFTKDTDQ